MYSFLSKHPRYSEMDDVLLMGMMNQISIQNRREFRSIYLKSVSSSARITHSTLFSVEFFEISSNTIRSIFKLFSQCPRSVFGTSVEIVGMASSWTSLKILKWIANCAHVRRIIGNRSLWYFSQVFTANKTLSRLMGLPCGRRDNNLSQLWLKLCAIVLHRKCFLPWRKWHNQIRSGYRSKAQS